MSQEENVMQPGGVESVSSPCLNDGEAKNEDASKPTGDDVVASHNLPPPASMSPEDKANVEDDSGSNERVNKGEQEDSDSDSEDDLQIIVNDEDIYFPHGTGNEGGQEGEGEEIFAVGGEEHYEDMDWMAEMHSYHSQFFKYVRPGTGPGEPSPGAPDGSGPFPANYPVGMWDYPFETAYEFILPPSQTIFDIDTDQFEEKPWDYPGVDMSDYFNFGFTEDTWKQYCEEFARAKEAYLASKSRDYEDGQGWNFDNGESEPVRLRNHGHRRNMRSIQMEGGGNERRDMRRQRLRDLQDGRSNEHHGDRRRQRNDDMQRRKGYSRTEQASSLGGRLSRTPSLPQTSPGGTFSSPSRDRRSGFYTPRSRLPSPGSAQNAGNGYRRHTMDSTSRPWQRSSRKHEFEDESYGSSDTDRHESEDEQLSARNHRLRRFSSQPLEKRLGARAEPPPDEGKSAPEKRVVRLSRYTMEEDEKKTVSSEPPRKLPPRIDKSPASADRAAEKRTSRELVTDSRLIQTTRKFYQAMEARAGPVSEKRTKDSTKPEAVAERKAEPAPERKLQSISERRAQFIAERKAAEKRERLLAEKRESALKLEAEKIKAPVKVFEKVRAEEVVVLKDRSGEPQEEIKSSKGVSVVKVEERADPVKDKDLRMQVIERVCSRWKFHIRRGDTRAKKRKHSMDSEGGGNEDAGGKSESPKSSYPERVEHGEAMARTREERKRTYREKQRQYDDDDEEEGYEDGADYDQRSERWQMDDVRERRSSLGHSATKRRYNDENGLVEAWAVDEPEYGGADDNNRWNGDQARRKRRKFNYNLIEEEHYADAEMGDSFNYNSRGRLYDGSTSSVQADDISYRRRGNSYSRKSDRWTGSLYDSGGEYDE